jgi:hypothetical protein
MYIEAMINSLALKQFIVCYLVLAEWLLYYFLKLP